MAKKKTSEEEYMERYSHWQDVFNNGCSDPNWSDGANLNLCRNQLIRIREKALADMKKGIISKIVLPPVPPAVTADYMAKKAEKFFYIQNFKKRFIKSKYYDGYKRFIKAYDEYHTKNEYMPWTYNILYRLFAFNNPCVLDFRQFGKEDAYEWWEQQYNTEKGEIQSLYETLTQREAVKDGSTLSVQKTDWGEQLCLF